MADTISSAEIFRVDGSAEIMLGRSSHGNFSNVSFYGKILNMEIFH